jgi:hypothetical protein
VRAFSHDQIPIPHVLREYALIADGRRGALIGPRGDLSFMCAPSWHDDAIFSSLIGGRGCFVVAPADPWFVWGGHYEDDSLIFDSRWITRDGVVECREAMAAPGEVHRAMVLRRVRPEAATTLLVRVDPRASFGRAGLRQLRSHDGVFEAVTGRLRVRLTGAPTARYDKELGLVAEIHLRAGEWHDLVFEVSDQVLPDELPTANELWEATANMWSEVTGDASGSIAPRDSSQAIAVLRGLTVPGGGMVAAATMSLPERADAGRNYDYRYAWIRDQCYAGMAAATLGPNRLVEDAVSFVAARILEDGEGLRPAYRVDGGPVPDEKPIRGLLGYPGGKDKVGNWVNNQFQLDALGEALELFAAAARCEQLSSEGRDAADVAVRAIEKLWRKPDAGIWELEADWWTHSRLECSAGLRAIAAPGLVMDPGRAASCEALADKLLAEVSRRCTHASGRWQRSPKDSRVDASLLLPPVRGALPAGDSRTVATYHSVVDELVRDEYTYRFRQDDRPLHDAEGAFLLCGFMMSLAALQQGDVLTALRHFERNRAGCGSPGLFSEEYDVSQRQLRGNLPQAFVHALALEAANRLGQAL